MTLEEMVEGLERQYGSLLPLWKKRQRAWGRVFSALITAAYFARRHGPKRLEGPALMIFDRHSFSSDAAMLAPYAGQGTVVTRKGGALFSRIAPHFGAIMVGYGADALAELKAQMYFHLNHKDVIAVFPFNDAGNEQEFRHGIVRMAMQWEWKRESGVPVKYIPAAARYSNNIPFMDGICRMSGALKKWPAPFAVRADIYVSEMCLLSNGLFPNSANAKALTEKIVSEGASLPYKRN